MLRFRRCWPFSANGTARNQREISNGIDCVITDVFRWGRHERTKKVVGYIRVSSIEQTKGHSLEAQEQYLRDYASGNGLRIVKLFSESHSAYTPGRPEFEKMLRYLEEHSDVRAILAYKFDRLTRNMSDHAILSSLSQIQIISATEALPEGATGEFLFNMSAAVARFYSAQLAERTSLGMLTKCRKGLYPSLAPLGYVNVKEPPCIVPDPIRANLVRQLFEHHARTGVSLSSLVDWASERGLTTRTGGPLRKAALHKMLQNTVYTGRFRWKDEMFDGIYEPLVSKAVFDRCQQRLAEKSHTVTKRIFPYRGLVICGHCGCQLTAAYAKKKYVYYRCTYARGKCEQGYIREDRLGERLASVVEAIHLTSAQVSELMHLLQERQDERAIHRRERLARLHTQREKIELRRDQGYSDKADGVLSHDRWMKMDKKWVAEDMVLCSEIEQLENQRDPRVDDVRATLELLNRAPDLYRSQSDAERARLLHALVWNLTITAESVYPVYRKPFDIIAKGASSANWYPREDSNFRPTV